MQSKGRKWQAIISISSSGPEYDPIFKNSGRTFLPRAVADLKYTTSDSDFFAAHFGKKGYDSSKFEKHFRLVNPSINELENAIAQVDEWFSPFRKMTDWDGGGILLIYAGHGHHVAGEMVLNNSQLFHPDSFIEKITNIAQKNINGERLRVSIIMDSCFSAEFGLRVLDSVVNQHFDILVPYMLFFSCCPDEEAWEEGTLGHGIFTYCFSVRENNLGSIAAQAIQPDNSIGPSLSLAKGEKGVSILTCGAQNPVVYFNGSGYVEVGDRSFSIFENDTSLSLDQMREKVVGLRDEFASNVQQVFNSFSIERSNSVDSRNAAKELKMDLSPDGSLHPSRFQ